MPKPAAPRSRATRAPSTAARSSARTTCIAVGAFCLWLAAPAWAAKAKLIDAPPPPPMPDAMLDEDGTPQKPPVAVTPSRGQLLYENHCLSCHESMVHIRDRHTVRSYPQLQQEVRRWADNARLPWGKEEVEDVVRHLDSRHYRFQAY